MDRFSSSHSHKSLTIIVLLSLMLIASNSNAINIAAIPDSGAVAVGDPLNVDIVISGLEGVTPNEIVRSYQLDILFNNSVVSATNVLFGNFLALNHPLTPFLQTSTILNDRVTILETSLWSDDVLDIAQPDSFTLASITFETIGAGSTSFEFLPFLNFGIDITGRSGNLLNVTPQTGNLTVRSVPEPSSLLLFIMGLSLILLVRKQPAFTLQFKP